MKLKILLVAGAVFFVSCMQAVPPHQIERLSRGIAAFKYEENRVFVSWRLLAEDNSQTMFNLYRKNKDGKLVRIHSFPLNKTNFTDTLPGENPFYLLKTVENGKESEAGTPCTVLKNQRANFIRIPLKTPSKYTPGDCSAGDLDGDGDPELIVHMTGIGRDNSQSGMTTPAILQAYKLDGTFLWEINLGINIREGAHYTQFLVYDFDGDNKAELICKTADGTRDGAGNVLGDSTADWRIKPDAEHPEEYTQKLTGRIMSGPEYLTVFEGLTGKALATTSYAPDRGAPGLWGDTYGNRSERFLAGVAYLDGKRPSAIFCRGYYTRATLVAWDWRNGKLQQRWMFDSYDGTPGNASYSGQGNHSLSTGDVDRDGCDEIVYGACVIDHNGKGLYSTGTGHGDALHFSDLDPTRPGMEIFQVHEDVHNGGDVAAGHFRDAATGRLLWGLAAKEDVGRGMCADLDPRYPGYECWSIASDGLYSARGRKISSAKPVSCNFGIWWDGSPDRELLDKNFITKWNVEKAAEERLFTADSCMSNNGTKANPCLSADLFGDWREEVVFRTRDNSELRIFSTTIPTNVRIRTLMQDPQYRCGVACQNVAYNQPPYPHFYLGTGMTEPDYTPVYYPG